MYRIHRVACHMANAKPYMSIPSDMENDADMILDSAIDELEKLRQQVAAVKKALE